jgi:NhaA family Na+:H+ antiporter
MKYLLQKFKEVSNSEIEVLANSDQQHIIHQMDTHIEEINPLMHKFESALHPWVTFFIMPVFALANSGVQLAGGIFQDSIPTVAVGIFFGLLVGKPVGIFLFSLLSVKLKLAELPVGTNWKQVFALGTIAGIGFTMSIFIDSLAFSDPAIVNIGKAAILATSSLSAVLGLVAVASTCRGNKPVYKKQ